MKCFFHLLFACTSYVANAQAILPAGTGLNTVKSATPGSHHRLLRHQRVKPFAINTTPTLYRGVGEDHGQVFDGVPFIEMNRFAGYVLQYERAGLEKIAAGKKEFRHYEMAKRARIDREGFLSAVNAIMQMQH